MLAPGNMPCRLVACAEHDALQHSCRLTQGYKTIASVVHRCPVKSQRALHSWQHPAHVPMPQKQGGGAGGSLALAYSRYTLASSSREASTCSAFALITALAQCNPPGNHLCTMLQGALLALAYSRYTLASSSREASTCSAFKNSSRLWPSAMPSDYV